MSGPTRRQFAMSLTASLICAPFLNLLSRPARAEGAGKADRLIIFFTPNGTVHRHIRPTGGELDFQLPAGSILEPLAPYARDIVYLDGIDFIGVNNHEAGMANMLTGGGGAGTESGGMSVDQYVAGKLGAGSRFPSLEFGVLTSAWGGNVQTRMCYSGPGRYVTPEDRPRSAFSRLFGAATGDGGAARLLRRRKSILDNIRGELTALQAGVGPSERLKLDQHLDAVRTVELSLSGGGGCAAPEVPADLEVWAHKNMPAIGRTQTDLMLLALSCGLTRVSSIQWSHTVGPPVFSWINQGEGHHELSHKGDGDAAGVASFVACERWYAQQFAYLLGKLKGTPDPMRGGTLLDSTLVVWAKELGDGRLHTCESVPFVLAGSAGGYLRTGRYLRYKNAPHQQLLVSICRAMGLGNNSFGDAGRGMGLLPGLAA